MSLHLTIAKNSSTSTTTRKRYALYRLDPDLQALHQRHPFVVIWDDHELSNDTWLDGAENHQANEEQFCQTESSTLQTYLNGCQFELKALKIIYIFTVSLIMAI